MKKYFKYIISLIAVLVIAIVPAMAQAVDATESFNLISYIKANSVDIIGIYFTLLAALKMIAKLTPTKKDDKIVSFLEKAGTLFFPDRKSGGGKHK